MNRAATIRTCFAILAVIVLAASIARANSESTRLEITLSQSFTLEELFERLPVVHFAIHNPYFDGELKVYRGFYLADLIWFLAPGRDGVVHFEALDGYRQEIELRRIFDEPEIVGLIAFEEVGVPGGFEPVTDGDRYIEDLRPYWLVWGHADPSQVSDGGKSLIDTRPWPWQLVRIWIEN